MKKYFVWVTMVSLLISSLPAMADDYAAQLEETKVLISTLVGDLGPLADSLTAARVDVEEALIFKRRALVITNNTPAGDAVVFAQQGRIVPITQN